MQTEDEIRLTPEEFLAEVASADKYTWKITGGTSDYGLTRNQGPEGWPIVTNVTIGQVTLSRQPIRVRSGDVHWDVPENDIVMPNAWTILIREPFVRREQRKLSEGGGFREVDDVRVALKLENPRLHDEALHEETGEWLSRAAALEDALNERLRGLEVVDVEIVENHITLKFSEEDPGEEKPVWLVNPWLVIGNKFREDSEVILGGTVLPTNLHSVSLLTMEQDE